MNIEIKKSAKPVNYFYAIDFLEERLQKLYEKKENQLIWTLTHKEIYTAGTSYNKITNQLSWTMIGNFSSTICFY